MKMLWILSLLLLSTGCAFKSTTYIKPNDRFILGDNPHGKVRLKLTNTSNQTIFTENHPIDGGSHSPTSINAGKTKRVKVEKNTALHIINNSTDTIAVKLKVRGDLNLSMGFKNK